MSWVAAAVVAAGGVGAATRLVVDGALRTRRSAQFPWATLAINVSGSFVLGVLTGLVLHRHTGADLRLVAGTGFCGGYTTFSTASFETVRLAQRGRIAAAAGYALGTAAVTVAAASLGLIVVR